MRIFSRDIDYSIFAPQTYPQGAAQVPTAWEIGSPAWGVKTIFDALQMLNTYRYACLAGEVEAADAAWKNYTAYEGNKLLGYAYKPMAVEQIMAIAFDQAMTAFQFLPSIPIDPKTGFYVVTQFVRVASLKDAADYCDKVAPLAVKCPAAVLAIETIQRRAGSEAPRCTLGVMGMPNYGMEAPPPKPITEAEE